MTSIVTDLCDALILEVEDAIQLPDHRVIRYVRPRAVTPALCPLLAVWYGGKMPAFLESGDPTNPKAGMRVNLVVGWWQEFTEEASTLDILEERYSEMLGISEQIEQLVIRLGTRDLMDGNGVSIPAWQILFGGSEAVSEEGLVEGYYIGVLAMIDQHG